MMCCMGRVSPIILKEFWVFCIQTLKIFLLSIDVKAVPKGWRWGVHTICGFTILIGDDDNGGCGIKGLWHVHLMILCWDWLSEAQVGPWECWWGVVGVWSWVGGERTIMVCKSVALFVEWVISWEPLEESSSLHAWICVDIASTVDSICWERSYKLNGGDGWFVEVYGVGTLCNSKLNGSSSKIADAMVLATQNLEIWAIFGCIAGRRMLTLGLGWRAIITDAKGALGPHSLEWGMYVYDVHFIHWVEGGWNSWDVWANVVQIES